MPEIGEVARIIHYLRKHLVGRTISSCTAFDDPIVYGKVGTSAIAFQDAVTGRRVTGADQQGKYFYVTFDKAPHAVMHLGMTGWIKTNVEDTGYYRPAKEKGVTPEWPPKFMKFLLKLDAQGEREAVELAFVDPRRLARIRLVECEEEKIREYSPLKENGPDPVRDKEKVTVQWLTDLLGRKRVPVKALLLDQGNLSGVGNWVADEVLYQARIHPEQYSNTFDDAQIKRLHDSLISVCTQACELLGDSERFPEHWLMTHRWNKGKKEANTLPNGEKIVHITVGGRTSAIVPSVQKKTAAVAGDVDDANGDENEEKPAKGRKRKSEVQDDEDDGLDEEEKPAAKKGSKKSKKDTNAVKTEDADGSKSKTSTPKKAEKPATPGSRRSSRIQSK